VRNWRGTGTAGIGVGAGTALLEVDISRDDGLWESKGSSFGSIDASGDTRAKRWRRVTLTLNCEGGVPVDVEGDEADEMGGEGYLGSGRTCLKTRGADVVAEVEGVQGRGYGAARARLRRPTRSCSFAWRFSWRIRSLSAFFIGAKR
jgi:hypothetical protein